jgi:hypothetical protein
MGALIAKPAAMPILMLPASRRIILQKKRANDPPLFLSRIRCSFRGRFFNLSVIGGMK